MILVTGGAGFIGSALVTSLIKQGFEVRALDCFLEESYSAELKKRNWRALSKLANLELVEIDLRNPVPNKVFMGVTAVVNEAAMPGLVQSWKNFSLYNECNTKSVFNLLEAAAQNKVQNFVQISTSSVYGNLANGDETSSLSPISPYGVSKLAGEELVRMFNRTHGVNYTILRYFSVYGPGQRPDMAYHRIIESILQRRNFEVFGDGSQIRTNTYVDDCVDATISALKFGPINGALNISGDDKITLNSAISVMEEILSIRASVSYHEPLIGDQYETSTSIEKAREVLRFEPKWRFSEGIAEQIEWHKNLRSS